MHPRLTITFIRSQNSHELGSQFGDLFLEVSGAPELSRIHFSN